MRHKYKSGDKVIYKGWEFEICKVEIFNFRNVEYSIAGADYWVIGLTEDELELVEWK